MACSEVSARRRKAAFASEYLAPGMCFASSITLVALVVTEVPSKWAATLTFLLGVEWFAATKWYSRAEGIHG